MAETSDPTDAPTPTPVEAQVGIRRAPKYSVFLLMGAALGALAAMILTFAFPATDEYSPGQVFGYLLLLCAVLGLALGGFVAWLFDAASRRRTRTAQAERSALADPDA